LEFNVRFQHKYGYITDKGNGMLAYILELKLNSEVSK